MRHQNRILLALALPLMLAGCAENGAEPEVPGTQTPGGEITFNIGFAADGLTRVATDAAFESTWEDGDQIGIFAVESGAALTANPTGNHIHNARLSYNETIPGDPSTGTWSLDPGTELNWPSDGTKLDFYAYHPWNTAATDPTAIAFPVPTDQSGANYNTGQLLTAKSDNGGTGLDSTSGAVPLDFSHALAMIHVTLDNTTGLLDTSTDPTVTLRGAIPAATLDLGAGTTGTATADPTAASPAAITMHRVTDPAAPAALVYRALVPPQTLAATTSLFRITDGTVTLASPPLAANLTLVAGQADKFRQRILAVDKTDLNNAIEEVLSLDEDDYTSDSWDNLQMAVIAAQAVAGNSAATTGEVSQALSDLTTARDNLILTT